MIAFGDHKREKEREGEDWRGSGRKKSTSGARKNTKIHKPNSMNAHYTDLDYTAAQYKFRRPGNANRTIKSSHHLFLFVLKTLF